MLAEPALGVLSQLNPPAPEIPLEGSVGAVLENRGLLEAAAGRTETAWKDGRLIAVRKVDFADVYAIAVLERSMIASAALQSAILPVLIGAFVSLCAAFFVLMTQRQERALAEKDRRLLDVAESVPGAVFNYSLNEDGTDSIEFLNNGCLDIWEVTAEEIGNDPQPLWEMVASDDLPAFQESVRISAEGESPWAHRWRITTPSGKKKILQGRAIPEKLKGGKVRWSTLILDVTDLETARLELEHSRELLLESQKRQSIGDLTGGVAHDFNNLLFVIKGNIELLGNRDFDPDDAELLDEIRLATDRSIEITRQLLLFGRNAPLKPKVLSLNLPVKELDRLIRRTLPATIKINCILGGGLWKTSVDPSHLQSAVLNLALNARDAMPNGGTITMETSNVRLSHEYMEEREESVQPGRFVMLAISDTGSGIPDDVIDRIFDPYFSTKGRSEGSGLGLSMVQGFMKQSGGIVRVYSEPGEGTSVKLYFPAELKDMREKEELIVDEFDDAMVVLVVEDDEQVRSTVKRQLKTLGYSCVEAANGDEALAAIEKGLEFNAVLTDIVMPGKLNGPALIAKIRERFPDIPAVIMSGYPEEAAVNGNGVDPKDPQLMKPLTLAELARAFRRLFEESARTK